MTDQNPDLSFWCYPHRLDSDFLPDDVRFYQRWLESGFHAGMAYLASERHLLPRANPALLWQPVRSILTLQVPYPHPESILVPGGQEPYGRIASYAWVADYHQTIPERIEELMSRLAKDLDQPLEWKVFTDSAPILERSLAAASGMGWIGKNTCLITPGVGSFFFLADVFLNLEPGRWLNKLQFAPQMLKNRCGSCQRCIQACPTGCIRSDRSIDAGRCISYLTIEQKGMTPPELRKPSGDWVFGCDVCQMVCPWNIRFGDRTPPGELAIPTPYPDLKRELELTETDFKQKYGSSPVSRAKRRGYRRNVCIALGNVGDANCVPQLLRTLRTDPEPLVRAAAVWAVSQIDLVGVMYALQEARKKETHPLVLDEFALALSQ